MQKLGLVIFLVFTFNFLSSSFATFDSPCTQAAEELHDGKPHQDHDDCHCPNHKVQCCGSMTMALKNNKIALMIPLQSEASPLFLPPSKPSPFLEGPFQPPRA